MSDLQELDTWLSALLSRLDDKHISQVNKSVGTFLRRSQSLRIAAQENPDGSKYAARSKFRSRAGRIRRRKMFSKLRMVKHLKNISDANSITVGFRGRSSMVASVHQYGEDSVSYGRQISMPQRRLLGLTDAELDDIREIYLGVLTGD